MKIKSTTIVVLSIATLAVAGVAYASTGTAVKQATKASTTEPAGQEAGDQLDATPSKTPIIKADSTKDAETSDDALVAH
jgi:hypothetical protein